MAVARSGAGQYAASMMTSVPLPGWRDLAALAAAVPADDQRLAGPWMGDGGAARETAFWFSRSAWALGAIVAWRRAVEADQAPVLWLPDYFCNQSTPPARAAGARLVFYPVTRDMQPRWEECRTMARLQAPHLFVLVHYFGQAADAATARAFCDETDALLVEDAAHVLAPAPGIGSHGDFVFYSPYKVLPVPDGGLLLMRREDGLAAMGDAVAGLGARAPSPWAWLGKRLIQKNAPAALLRNRCRSRSPAFADDPPTLPLAATPLLSAAARRLLANAGQRLAESAERRWHNVRVLGRALGRTATAYRPYFADGRETLPPYRLVLDCDDAAACFAELRRRGWQAESWPDLPPEVAAEPERHADALALRRTLVFLPVDGRMDPGLRS